MKKTQFQRIVTALNQIFNGLFLTSTSFDEEVGG